ncbi:MAG: hypothetical protein VX694_07590 [Planctomycetota bacterium]|nr:hypothetical protein [Planctomycetota bacterium]
MHRFFKLGQRLSFLSSQSEQGDFVELRMDWGSTTPNSNLEDRSTTFLFGLSSLLPLGIQFDIVLIKSPAARAFAAEQALHVVPRFIVISQTGFWHQSNRLPPIRGVLGDSFLLLHGPLKESTCVGGSM